MQRLARMGISNEHQTAVQLFERFNEFKQIVQGHLPPSTANLFARPIVKDAQVVEWYSELEGQPVALGSSASDQQTRQQIEPVIYERLQQIDALRQNLLLRQLINSAQADLLSQLVRAASYDQSTIYLVNGEPVIVAWAMGRETSAYRSAPMRAQTTVVGVPMAVTNSAVAGVAMAPNLWRWLLPLLLLLLLVLGFAWWWLRAPPVNISAQKGKTPEPVPSVNLDTTNRIPTVSASTSTEDPSAVLVEPVPTTVTTESSVREAPKHEMPKPAETSEVSEGANATAQEITAIPVQAETEAQLIEVVPTVAEPEGFLITASPIQKLEAQMISAVPLAEKPVDTPPEKPESKAKPETPKNCTNRTVPRTVPQMVIAFDNSYSMMFTLTMSANEIRRLLNKWDAVGLYQHEFDKLLRKPNRLGSAKSAAVSVIKRVNPSIDIGLVEIANCNRLGNNHGFFKPNQRKALSSRIRNFMPSQQNGGTPLYESLRKAAAMVDGRGRDAFILLISDGEDSCTKKNICSLASTLKKTKPRLKVNLVNIGGTTAANCVARITGGNIFSANSPGQVSAMINRAAKPMTDLQECK